jgi:hypothetical protein
LGSALVAKCFQAHRDSLAVGPTWTAVAGAGAGRIGANRATSKPTVIGLEEHCWDPDLVALFPGREGKRVSDVELRVGRNKRSTLRP